MRWSVSVKAVLLRDDCVLLGRNDRGEWELPGGRMEHGESTRETLVRELREETGLQLTPGPLLLAEPFEVLPGATVFVVAYSATTDDQALVVSGEHLEIAYLPLDSLTDADLPQVYRLAIARALT